jgi:hypothetical protein
MALFSSISDNFDDNTIGAMWTNNYGGAVETGGRARIPCVAATYAGYQTSKIYTLQNSSIFIELVTVPAVSTATDLNVVFGILGPTDGTNLQFHVNPATGNLRLESNVAYFDAGATSITFSHVTHRWMRYLVTGGNLLFDTSPDGNTWTNRRTLATPAWVSGATDTLGVEMFSFRDAGTTDFAEWDNLNIAPTVTNVVGKSNLNTAQAIRRAHTW